MPQRLKPVALIIDSQIEGNRHYIALNKEGKQVFETTVYDSGHGGSIAHERLKEAGFKSTWAEWAIKLIQQHNRKRLTTFQ